MKLQLIVSIVVLSKLCMVYGITVEDYKNLQKHLMTNYSNKQQLVTTAYLSMIWLDELLVWDKQITNIDRLYFKQKDIWTPDIVLKNGVKKFKELGGEFYYLEVLPNGEVCDITFISWSFTKLEVNMTLPLGIRSVYFYDFVENSVWGIESTGGRRSQSDNADSTVTFTLHLRRKPLYYVMNLILPVVLLGVISLLVFVIPADTGEKMSFAVTVFLSFAVFLSIISLQLPVNSEKTSLLGVYLVFQMSIAVASIIISAFQLRLHHRCEERKVGTFYRGIVRIERCLRCVKSCSDNNSKKKYDWRNDSCEPKVDNDDVSWKDVSSAIDFVCFWTMLFFGIIATTVLVLYMNIDI
uniref:Neuronal acetylcholine receptor subunit alpha-6 n=1 Tax=Magallana gigas TaxID=29159 RepID=A0A8W8IMA7_MAGGI